MPKKPKNEMAAQAMAIEIQTITEFQQKYNADTAWEEFSKKSPYGRKT
jgi:hypothetical protein